MLPNLILIDFKLYIQLRSLSYRIRVFSAIYEIRFDYIHAEFKPIAVYEVRGCIKR